MVTEAEHSYYFASFSMVKSMLGTSNFNMDRIHSSHYTYFTSAIKHNVSWDGIIYLMTQSKPRDCCQQQIPNLSTRS